MTYNQRQRKKKNRGRRIAKGASRYNFALPYVINWFLEVPLPYYNEQPAPPSGNAGRESR